MSKTIIDMPKVCQMLDSGWVVSLYENSLGTYTAEAWHENTLCRDKAVERLREQIKRECKDKMVRKIALKELKGETIVADDRTPEQTLTRLAYKVMGEIIRVEEVQ